MELAELPLPLGSAAPGVNAKGAEEQHRAAYFFFEPR